MERKFQPVIIFSFSRRECEHHAMSMSKLDFNTEDEKDCIEQVFSNAIKLLKDEDKSLPAIELMLPLLKRGIAVHHSGLLPIIKELVELLFQEGLVKALFATETVWSLPSTIPLSHILIELLSPHHIYCNWEVHYNDCFCIFQIATVRALLFYTLH